MLSVLDLFRVGIGPSSSHTVGPIRIAARFVEGLAGSGRLPDVSRVEVELQGSLALTGEGHATPKAVLLGLSGFAPETLDPDEAETCVADILSTRAMSLAGRKQIGFDPAADIIMAYDIMPALHPNGMRLRAFDGGGKVLQDETWYSTGGGFIASQRQLEKPLEDDLVQTPAIVPYPYTSAAELIDMCTRDGLTIEQLVLANEDAMRPRPETLEALDRIAGVMQACIRRGLSQSGTLPGKLKVRRRAAALWDKLAKDHGSNEREQLFDWLNVYAMAVNEENAAGGKVVTAPTNGAPRRGNLGAATKIICVPAGRRQANSALPIGTVRHP